jgi:hypothetical protein
MFQLIRRQRHASPFLLSLLYTWQLWTCMSTMPSSSTDRPRRLLRGLPLNGLLNGRDKISAAGYKKLKKKKKKKKKKEKTLTVIPFYFFVNFVEERCSLSLSLSLLYSR